QLFGLRHVIAGPDRGELLRRLLRRVLHHRQLLGLGEVVRGRGGGARHRLGAFVGAGGLLRCRVRRRVRCRAGGAVGAQAGQPERRVGAERGVSGRATGRGAWAGRAAAWWVRAPRRGRRTGRARLGRARRRQLLGRSVVGEAEVGQQVLGRRVVLGLGVGGRALGDP